MNKTTISLISIILIVLTIHISYADSLRVNMTNDFINHTDRHLTSSILLSYMVDSESQYYDNLKFSFEHNIYTPEDTSTTIKSDFDMPYAGEIITQYTFYKLSRSYYNALGIVIGYIGKNTYAEEVQKTVHEIISVGEPKGWDYQIGPKNIAGLNYTFEHNLLRKDFLFNEISFSYKINAMYTTTQREARTQIEFRYGNNFPNNYIDTQVDLEKTNGWDVSFGLSYYYMDYNYILDNFKEEYDISRKKSVDSRYLKFNLYRKSSIYSLNLTTAGFEMTDETLTEKWIGIEYTYLFD